MSHPFEPIKTAAITWFEGLPQAAFLEAKHFSKVWATQVFIDGNQLLSRWQVLGDGPNVHFIIAETGFGCGLNFLLTWFLWERYAPPAARLYFIASEPCPLALDDLARCFALWPTLDAQSSALLAHYPILTPGFHQLQFSKGRIMLTLMLGETETSFQELLVCGDSVLERKLRGSEVDAWFLNQFSGGKNAESLFATIDLLSKRGTTLATDLTADNIQQGLKSVGFSQASSPFSWAISKPIKPHVTVGVGPRSNFCLKRHTPWHVAPINTVKIKHAIVLGAGLAGCYTAHALARRGFRVTLIDEACGVGGGASGNRQAILFPQLSAYRSPLNVFMLHAYLFARRVYPSLMSKKPFGNLSGLLQLAYNEKEEKAEAHLKAWLETYPKLGVLVDREQASVLAGISVTSGGLFIPGAGTIDSPQLCQLLMETAGIDWVADTAVTSLLYEAGEWHVNGYHAEVLVLANGFRASQFAETSQLPLKTIRGQMTSILSNEASERLKMPLCGNGHVLPACDGEHALGATYQSGSSDSACYQEDDTYNLERLNSLPIELIFSNQVSGNWAGVRAATPDYLPLVGPVADAELFKAQFQGLASNSKRWVPSGGVFHKGLFLCAGFGSRGLTSIPFCAEWLGSLINSEPGYLPRHMVQALSPARFLRQKIIHTNIVVKT